MIELVLYRARIGSFASCSRWGGKCQRCVNDTDQVMYLLGYIYDNIRESAHVLSIFLKYVLILLCVFNYLLDIFQENYLSKNLATTLTFGAYSHMPVPFVPKFSHDHYRIVVTCFSYCIGHALFKFIHATSSSSVKTVCNTVYLRLFHRKSFGQYCANVYSIWIFSLNLILIALTIPNIINPGPIKDVSVLYHNAQGFVNVRDKSPSPQLFTNKVSDFQGHIFTEKPDIVILNETWLKSQVLDSELFPNSSYKVFRRDRSKFSHPPDINDPNKYRRQGGGVIIAFRSDLDIKTTEFKISDKKAKAEILSVVVKSQSGGKLCISTLYRVGNLEDQNLMEVDRHLRSIATSKSIHRHILIGDLNLNKTTWPEGQSTCNLQSRFVGLFNDMGFDQLINEPTHKDGKTLDLLLTNKPELITNVEVLPRNMICNSDHFGIKFNVKLDCKRLKPTKRKIYNFKKADFKSINSELLNVPWEHLLNDCDPDAALEKFESVVFSVCDRFIPKVTVKSSFEPPWFDSELDSICKKKNKLLTKYRKTNDPNVNEEIKKVRKEFRTKRDQKKRDNVVNDDDPALIKKKFWSFFKSTSNSCRIPETVNYGSRFRSENTDVANLFNKFFSDQFSTPSNYDIDLNFNNDPFHGYKFEEHKIFDLLRTMNANKAAGPDGLQSKLLKSCARGLAKPLSVLFGQCFALGKLPNKWKLANVIPIFKKKGSKSSVENYRPISLTCLPMKIFEYCIRDMLMSKCNHLLNNKQHGFRPERSCLTQLIPFTNSLALALNNSSRVDVVYFDFAKAFDSVNHDIILHKLKNKFGIDGSLLQFIRGYLQDRKQQVLINGSKSDTLPVHSGVPQGSILGPLLFVLFIDDMISVVSKGTEIALYADDTKIWREINSELDQIILQSDIDKLHEWSMVNKMKFHPDKCKVVPITNKPLVYDLPFYEHFYTLNDNILDYETSEKDLGVVINSKLLWNTQCESLVQKANKQLGLVRRTCHFVNNSKQRRALYLSLVRSMFEHCCQVWAPQNLKSLYKFDQLQKRAVKWILKESYVRYSDDEFLQKQKDLDLLPMKSKFLLSDLILFYKIVYNNIKIDLPNYISRIEPQDVKRATRSNISVAEGTDKLKYKCEITPKINAFSNSFFVRTMEQWNQLPLHLRQIENVKNFSCALKEHLWLILGLKPD